MCFVDLEKTFDRVLRKVVEWAMRKRGLPEVMVRAVMSLYEGAKTRVRVDQELSEEFEVKVSVHQGSCALLWNDLPKEMRNLNTLSSFKKEINKYTFKSDSHTAIMKNS